MPTILIPGTGWQASGGWIPESNGYRGLMEYGATLSGDVGGTQLLRWPGGRRDSDRLAAAEMLTKIIAAHSFADGETLHIIAHSHGGNVALAASHQGLTHPIDTLITLNKPTLVGDLYQPRQDIGAFYNISAVGDLIQIFASNAYSNWPHDPHAINHFIDTRSSNIKPHAALIWDDHFRDAWWQWFLSRQSRALEAMPVVLP